MSESSTDTSPELEGIGQCLQLAREGRGISLQAVEDATHIRLRYLEAIEAGRSQDIPGDVFVKGFLRTYADHLGLDGPALVEEYKRAVAAAQRARIAREGPPRPEPPLMPVQRRRARAAPWSVAAVVVCGGIVLWVLHARTPVSVPTTAGGIASSHSSRGSDAFSSTATAPTAVNPTSTTEPSTPTTGTTVRAAFQHLATGWQDTYTLTGATSLTLLVHVVAGGGCWVRHWDDGALQPDALLSYNSSTTWTAAQSIRLLTGCIPGLVLTVDGEALPAMPAVRQNPAVVLVELAGAQAGA